MPKPENASEICSLILAHHPPEPGAIMFVTLAYPEADRKNWRVGNAGVGDALGLMEVLTEFIARQEPTLQIYANLRRGSAEEPKL